MDENAKKKGLRMIPYGLQVLGAKHGDKQTVATINWTTQASFAPPLVVIGVKTDSTAHELVKQSKKFTLSMLGTGQKDLAWHFSNTSSRSTASSAITRTAWARTAAR